MTHLGDRIAAFVDGQLPPDERRIAESHVASCDECRNRVREQQLLKSRVTSMREVRAPDHLLASLSDVERLAAVSEPDTSKGWLTRCLQATTVRTLVAMTGASLTVTALAYGVGGPADPDHDVVTPPVEEFAADFAASAPTVRPDEDRAGAPATDLAVDVSDPVFVVDSNRVVGSDDPTAVWLLRESGGPSEYLDQLVRNFHISTGTTSVIGGRTAVEVRASRAGEVAAVFWVDAITGELLRRLRYDESGQVVDSRDFTAEDTDETSGDALNSASAQAAPIGRKTLDALENSGWPCHDLLARDMGRLRGHWVDVAGDRAVRLTYSDGLNRLAVYEQRGTLDASDLAGFESYRVRGSRVWLRVGKPNVAVWSAHGVVYTVVTDAGPKRLRSAVAELPHERPSKSGTVQRVQTGLTRMGSWLVPV